MNINFTNDSIENVTFGSGCFWCTEAFFENLKGVLKVESGYMGGASKNPTYKEVCSGTTGHAEVVRVTFNTNQIKFEELLEVFWKTHDPTTLNRQGADVGTQYRSSVFYENPEQKKLAESYKEQLNDSGIFEDVIVTEIVEAATFYKAEDYHQNYFDRNGEAPYCQFVIRPKIEKFRKSFSEKLNP